MATNQRIIGGAIDSRVQVSTADAPRIVTRQQLRDAAFFSQVKADMLEGKVVPIDERLTDLLLDGGQVVAADSARGREVLAELQAKWSASR